MQTRVSRDTHRCAASLELEGQISLTTLTEANVAFGVCRCYGIFSLLHVCNLHRALLENPWVKEIYIYPNALHTDRLSVVGV